MTVLVVIVAVTSELPDPGRLATVAFASLFGGFVGGFVGRAQGQHRARVTEMATDGAFLGFAVGFTCWLIAVAIDRL